MINVCCFFGANPLIKDFLHLNLDWIQGQCRVAAAGGGETQPALVGTIDCATPTYLGRGYYSYSYLMISRVRRK